MSRFFSYVHRWLQPTYFKQVPLAIDLGPLTTRIMVKGNSSLVQPTVIAFHKQSGQVLALGQRASDLLGKTSTAVNVVFPLSNSHINSSYHLKNFLIAVVDNIGRSGKFSPFTRLKIAINLPQSTRLTHRRILQDMIKDIKYVSHVSFLSPLQAAYHSLMAAGLISHGCCLVVIGEDSTEIGVFHQGEIVQTVSIAVGEEKYVAAIIQTVRQLYQTEIGFDTALKMKDEISSLTEQPLRTVVRGKNILSNLPSTVQVSSVDFAPFFQNMAQTISQATIRVFSKLAPELLSVLIEQGVVMTGSGSLVKGLDVYLSEQLHCPVKRSPHPREDVLKGLWSQLKKQSL